MSLNFCKRLHTTLDLNSQFTGNRSEIIDQFDSPLKLDSKYEIALTNLETWHSFPNVDKSNNRLKYSHNNGTTWTTLKVPEGSYEIDELGKEIDRKMKLKDHEPIKIYPNTSTIKSVMELPSGYRVDFR